MQPLYCEEELFFFRHHVVAFCSRLLLLFPDYYIGRRTDPYTLARLPAGNVTDLPLLTRQSWYATSIGAATAIDE
jgi:hypothetical protein